MDRFPGGRSGVGTDEIGEETVRPVDDCQFASSIIKARAEQDEKWKHFDRFLTECCIEVEGASTSVKDLNDRYNEWCEANIHESKLSRNGLAEQWDARGFPAYDGYKGKKRKGIVVKG